MKGTRIYEAWLALALLASVGLTSCSSFSVSHPLIIAPTVQDWQAAFSRLQPTEQALLRQSAPAITVLPGLQNLEIRTFPGPNYENGLVIRFPKLDLLGIVDGYNRVFSAQSAGPWKLIAAKTFFDYTPTEGGTQIDRFELRWKVTKSEQTIHGMATESGPGVKILWGASDEAIAAEANQAFALAFLRLMLELKNAAENGQPQ